jgi:hypothetical protein
MARARTRARKFEVESLEAKQLLSTIPLTAAHLQSFYPFFPVHFEGTSDYRLNDNPYGSGTPIQVVKQGDGEAAVTFWRDNSAGALQVWVGTEPSPAVGVNVGAVNQTVTFADGQDTATIDVPILPGASNPGEVDVRLAVRSVDPSAQYNYQLSDLNLRILGSDLSAPPKVASAIDSSQGIVLNFNKPMDPVSASNVNNYAIDLVNVDGHRTGGLFGLFGQTTRTYLTTKLLKVASAQYDAATQSVTLVPAYPGSRHGFGYVLGETVKLVQGAKAPVRRARKQVVAGGLVDQQGNLINADTTPGKVEVRMMRHTYSRGPSFS